MLVGIVFKNESGFFKFYNYTKLSLASKLELRLFRYREPVIIAINTIQHSKIDEDLHRARVHLVSFVGE